MATAVANGDASHAPIEISIPLPRAPRTDINLRLHDNGPNITLYLTTSAPDAAASVPLGSLVYAMPNVSLCNEGILVIWLELTPHNRKQHQASLSVRRFSPTARRSISQHGSQKYLHEGLESRFMSAVL